MTKEEYTKLQEDIKASREKAIQYNADVLNGDVCLVRRAEFVAYLKEIGGRAKQWRHSVFKEKGDE